MRCLILSLAATLSLLLTGCSTLVAPSYSADYSLVDSIKRQGLTKTSVGKAQPDDIKAKVNQITLRASPLTAGDTTFAGYVGNALASDLKDAGLFDANAPRRIDIVLLANNIDVSGFSQGSGQIEIELTVTNAGNILLRKKYSAQTKFESSFAGAIAIPRGQIEYPNLVRSLLSKVYQDADFLNAMKLH